MKTKYTLIIFALGIGLDMLGAMFKILHLPGGGSLLIVGLLFKLTGGLGFLYKLASYPRFKDFLES